VADGKTKGAAGERDRYKLELVGLAAGGERPSVVVEVRDRKDAVIHAEEVGADGAFTVPAEALERASRVVVGAADGKGGIEADGALTYRAAEFTAQIQKGTLALAEPVWSRLSSADVSAARCDCAGGGRWFDNLVAAATLELATSAPAPAARESVALDFASSVKARRRSPALAVPLLSRLPGHGRGYRRTCCCWPIVIDDVRSLISSAISSASSSPASGRAGRGAPPPPPIDPPDAASGGGSTNWRFTPERLARPAAGVERAGGAIRQRPRPSAPPACHCSARSKWATGTLHADSTFNIAGASPGASCGQLSRAVRLRGEADDRRHHHDDLRRCAAGAWYSPGDHPTLTRITAALSPA
jgi:hypothetical protein